METEPIFIYIYTRNTRNCEFHTQNSDLLFTFSCQAFANLTKPQILHQKKYQKYTNITFDEFMPEMENVYT